MQACTDEMKEVKTHLTGGPQQQALTSEEMREKRKRDREFIRIVNELVAEHGILTDDEFFRVL